MKTYRDRLYTKALESNVPEHCIGGLLNYIVDRIHPGGFLEAVLSNDLEGACSRADETNRHHMWDYMFFLHNHAPATCWGSPELFCEWLEREEKAG